MADADNTAPPAVERWVVRFGVALPILGLATIVAINLAGHSWWPALAFLAFLALMVVVLVLIEAHELHISPAAAWRRQWARVRTRKPRR